MEVAVYKERREIHMIMNLYVCKSTILVNVCSISFPYKLYKSKMR